MMGLPTSDPELEMYGFEIWWGNTGLKKSLDNIFVGYKISVLWWNKIYM